MSGDRLLDLTALGMLGCVAAVGLTRALLLAARGVWVLPIDRKRSLPEALTDLAFLLGLAVWVYEAIATGIAPDARLAPASLRELTIPWTAVRCAGLALAGTGTALYVRSLHDFGGSWRFTIDREQPGELVTSGVFALSRNPVYLALSLVLIGVSLALGSIPLTVLAAAAPLYFRQLIPREERFLQVHYGERYARYSERVPRWWRWPRPSGAPRQQG
jgi:protein-S-isoprenylcysteine O-methyltransferase Ste14